MFTLTWRAEVLSNLSCPTGEGITYFTSLFFITKRLLDLSHLLEIISVAWEFMFLHPHARFFFCLFLLLLFFLCTISNCQLSHRVFFHRSSEKFIWSLHRGIKQKPRNTVHYTALPQMPHKANCFKGAPTTCTPLQELAYLSISVTTEQMLGWTRVVQVTPQSTRLQMAKPRLR